MSGLYKGPADKQADIVAANCNVNMRWRPTSSGKMQLEVTTSLEKAVMLEERAEALGRLAINAAMMRQ